MRRVLTCGLVLTALFALPPLAASHETKSKGLKIVHPNAVEPRPGDASLLVTMKIELASKEADRLVRAETPLSPEVRLVTGSETPTLDIAAKSTLELTRQGPHIEVVNPKGPFIAYATFPMTLTFETRGKVAIDVMIEERDGVETGHDHHK